MEVRCSPCCGLAELAGISGDTPAKITKSALQYYNKAFFMFTGASYAKDIEAGYAKRLVKHIEKQKLGTVTQSPPRRNPNSENYVTVYLWAVKQGAVEE